MSKIVFIVANSGTGKSSSLREFKRDEASVISCSGKELPFKNDLKFVIPKSYPEVLSYIEMASSPVVVIDDANYMMSFEEMNRATEIGFTKFTQMAVNFYTVIKTIIDKRSPNQIFYVLSHSEDRDDGKMKIKTTGKMLSEKIVLEGLSNVLLTTEVTPNGEFVFKVRTDGTGVKSPMGMFEESFIPNDLKLVDKTIRAYYGMTDEPIKKVTK